jgi:16S rRNA (uracil1498-N3)-methyltransferase
MRAIYFPNQNLKINEEVKITDDPYHHLVRVLRVKKGETILLLNGEGLIFKVDIVDIQKKHLTCLVIASEHKQRSTGLDLIIGYCKKEYLEAILRMCVEVGVNEIYLLKCDYAQTHDFREERVRKVLVSALEQSNNPYLPVIKDIEKFIDLKELSAKYDQLLWFNSQLNTSSNLDRELIQKCERMALLIGPEGGFSSKEELYLREWERFVEVHLPVPIMKAVTAVPVAVGYALGIRA